MNEAEFLKLVSDMREAQKAYFMARRQGSLARDELNRSRSLERKVDEAIKDMLSNQGKLI